MLRIGELASATGEKVRTLRYWEAEGLLEAERSESGYRLFPAEMIPRVSFLRDAQALGLTLHEISELVELRRDGRQPCQHVRAQLREHLDAVRAQLTSLQDLERDLAERLAWAEAHPEPECDDGCVYLSEPSAAADGRRSG